MSLDEGDIIERIRAIFASLVPDEALSFEDDAALLSPPAPDATRIVTTDVVVEDVDFALGLGPLESAGHRALVQNLSDLCAMGAFPVGFVWSLSVPRRWLDDEADWLLAFCRGAAACAASYGALLLGGDLSSTSGPFSCAITAFGDVEGAPLLRRGARPGHRLFLSHPTGASQRGLEVLLEGRRQDPEAFGPAGSAEMRARFAKWREALSEDVRAAVDAHLFPAPEVSLGPALVGVASACIDVSDGLLQDLSRLVAASGFGAELEGLEQAVHAAAGEGDERLARALGGGEEYALLFALPPKRRLPRCAAEAVLLGKVVAEPGIALVDDKGLRRPLEPAGYDHFRRTR